MKKFNENPFYGQRGLLDLIKKANGLSITDALALIEQAFKSFTSSDRHLLQMFHVICFSQGDITNRYHNIFKGNDHQDLKSGGESNNNFWLAYLIFLLKTPRLFVKLLPLIIEYVGLRELTTYQIRTKKKTKTITGDWGLLPNIMDNDIAYTGLLEQLVRMANGSDFQKYQVAKFVNTPKLSKRQGGPLQDKTVTKMKLYKKLITDLSERMNWEIQEKEDYVRFVGFINWRKPINEQFEYYLMSTGKLQTYDKEKFLVLIDNLPSGAKFAVQRSLLDKDLNIREGKELQGEWFKEWLSFKEVAQKEQRVLEEKEKSEGLTVMEKEKLEKVKRKAKVNTGAFNLVDAMNDIIQGTAPDTTIHSVLDKITFNVPVLLCVDTSGSMGSRWGNCGKYMPIIYARLFTTLILLKNPVDENIFFDFHSTARVYTSGTNDGNEASNRFMKGSAIKVQGLVDKTDKFSNNFAKISKLLKTPGGRTNISAIPETMKQWVDSASDAIEKNHRIELIQQYPVFLLLSDSEFNNRARVERSLANFQMKMKQWFGHEPVIVLWDINSMSGKNDFSEMENVIHYSGVNLSNINQIFTKIHDLDIVDVYTQLKSLYESKRYELVKAQF